MLPFYSQKKYPSWCTCCGIPIYLKNKRAAYYHNKCRMPPKKRSSSSSNSSIIHDIDEQTVKKRSSQDESKELALFYRNCESGGTISSALEDDDPSFFDKTVDKALKKLSKEDKMSLLKNFQEKFTIWKGEKTAMKEDYENVYSSMIDEDWRDYVEDLKKKIMLNGIVGDYYKSTLELEEEQEKLLSIVEVIKNEIQIREKVESELIWAKVISKIDAKVLNGDTKVYERIGSNTAHRRLLNNYNTSPPSLVSFAHQSSSSSLGGQQGTEEEAQEVDQSTEQQVQQLQQVQQAQLVLQGHAVAMAEDKP